VTAARKFLTKVAHMNTRLFGGNSMAGIDGEKVRKLREAKGLTQLYVATVVGVTTDTISRWENRRYPNIKQENAEKLAEALDVELQDILEEKAVSEPEPAAEPAAPAEVDKASPGAIPKRQKSIWPRLIPVVLIILALVVIWRYWAGQHQQPDVTIAATRVLPSHVPAGQTFPVVILVDLHGAETSPLILKETLPHGCEAVASAPKYTNVDDRQNILKWISRNGRDKMAFVYLVKTPPTLENGSVLDFSGTVTRKESGSQVPISGRDAITISEFHWADANSDNRIDDEEILTAYDKYAALDALNFDWGEIDDIWSGQGYRWDDEKHAYSVIE
jgi:transcriptional regulator with XRE-family HTH domain